MSSRTKHQKAMLRGHNKRNTRSEKTEAARDFQTALEQADREGFDLVPNTRAQILILAIEDGLADYIALKVRISKDKILNVADGTKKIPQGPKRQILNAVLDDIKNSIFDEDILEIAMAQQQISDAELQVGQWDAVFSESEDIAPTEASHDEGGDESWEVEYRAALGSLAMA